MDPITAAYGGVLALIVGLFGRWLGARTGERRDLLQQALQRVAALEARSDMLQTLLASAQKQLADERTDAAVKIALLGERVAQLEADLADERAENQRLRGLPQSRRSHAPPTLAPALAPALEHEERETE